MQTALNLARTAPRFIVLGAGRYLSLFAKELPASIHQQRFVLALIAFYWVCGVMIGKFSGLGSTSTVSTYLPTYTAMIPMMVVALLLGRGVLIVAIERPALPLTRLAREIATSLATPQRLAHAAPILAGMLVFGGTFTLVKSSIQFLAPFAWDTTFEQWDKWLFGGTDPWQLLQPLLGSPIVTGSINWAYNFWFYFLFIIWVWQAFSQRDERLRQQFFLSLIVGWILLGNVAATIFSSAGPCYFGRVTGLPDPFQPLMSYLQDANQTYSIWALHAQEMLWQKYSTRGLVLGGGISAMPSMHVAMATLFALVCWRTRRWMGIAMAIYAMIIMIGSVHLAWHYAVDGIASVVGMLLIWWAVGRLLGRRQGAGSEAPALA